MTGRRPVDFAALCATHFWEGLGKKTGAIEEHSDAVLLVFREEYYLERAAPAQKDNESDEKYAERKNRHFQNHEKSKGRATVIIAKWRQGHIGDVSLGFNPTRQLFYDPEDPGGPP